MYTISLGRKKPNNTSTMIYESTDMRVYDDVIPDQQQQTKNSQNGNPTKNYSRAGTNTEKQQKYRKGKKYKD
ncbi:hypothetical protein Glove_411g19 [Diversispora epigaea]|uniref:Uncharacterized protein n=1 Tax=Diversispora epigaea TaxID=1348612 RepID=A0A397GXW3_9GLOM|nr:hypothetical protein Glove_411g19 [Diversispora epigaea]